MKLSITIAAMATHLVLLGGCATPKFVHDMLPPVYSYSSKLVAATDESGDDVKYSANPDGSVTFDRSGLRVTARHLDDLELNRRYPDVSRQDRFSANPFTYGNWRDPKLGFTPSRFTVFEIGVHNAVLPKVELFPANAALTTSRGDEFSTYAINREQSDKSLEQYYTIIRGPGGNEQYRFDQRMGIIRAELYRSGHRIFKGDDYSGYLVFEPLGDGADSAQLLLPRFAISFDEADLPNETIQLAFDFRRQVSKEKLTGAEADKARRRDWILPGGSSR